MRMELANIIIIWTKSCADTDEDPDWVMDEEEAKDSTDEWESAMEVLAAIFVCNWYKYENAILTGVHRLQSLKFPKHALQFQNQIVHLNYI